MKNKAQRGIRPCNGRSIAICVITFLLTVVLLSLAITSVENNLKILFAIFAIVLMILGVLLFAIYMYRYNSPIYIDEQSISQKQFGKTIKFEYSEVDNITFKHSMFFKVPAIISMYQKNQRIVFELTSDVLDEITAKCSCDDLVLKINKIRQDNSI